MRVSLDRDRCAGHGRCYVLAPTVFGADDDGYGTVLIAEPVGEAAAEARIGLMNCPEDAITIDED